METKLKRRITMQRKIILDELRGMKTHPTADELFFAVRKRLPKISLGTVYRNLDVLFKEGLIRKIHSPGGKMRFDGDISTHFHFLCIKCSKLLDIPKEAIPSFEVSSLDKLGIKVTEFRLEFRGICPRCQANDN